LVHGDKSYYPLTILIGNMELNKIKAIPNPYSRKIWLVFLFLLGRKITKILFLIIIIIFAWTRKEKRL
jgi:hypothetical protein